MLWIDSRIYSHDHPSLTVRRLRTVQPHGLVVRDGHIECPYDPACAAVKGDETGVYASIRVAGQRLARGQLGGLCDGVISCAELEL